MKLYNENPLFSKKKKKKKKEKKKKNGEGRTININNAGWWIKLPYYNANPNFSGTQILGDF